MIQITHIVQILGAATGYKGYEKATKAARRAQVGNTGQKLTVDWGKITATCGEHAHGGPPDWKR